MSSKNATADEEGTQVVNDIEGATDEVRGRTSVRRHVEGMLAPLKIEPTFGDLASWLMRQAEQDPELATLFMDIQSAAGDGRDLLDEKQSDLVNRVRSDDVLDLPSAPDWLRPTIVAGYLLAQRNLTPQVAARIMADPHRAFRDCLDRVRSLEPGFIGELIIESHLAQRDRAVATRMNHAAAELRPLVGELYSDVPPSAIARAASQPGASGSCQACRGGRCVPISCWVIVIVIVIVVVTK